MPDTNILVFELPEKELSTALAAFKLAHKEDADLRFAPDRAWIEGYAAASKAKHTEAPKSPDAEETRRTDVALAIWEVMREHEDRCDLSLDDIPTSHQVWLCADAAIAAQAAPVDAAVQPDRTGIYAWVSGSSTAMVLVNKRPSNHAPGGQWNGHVIDSTRFYDGCPIPQWGRDGRWTLLHDFGAARAAQEGE